MEGRRVAGVRSPNHRYDDRVARGLVLLFLWVVLTGLPSAVRAGDPADGEPDAPEVERADLVTPAQVDDAVARGVEWLRGEQRRDGRFGTGAGETALALMALRHSGVPADDKVCRRAARSLVRELPDGKVYGAALGVLALLAQDEPGHREIAEKLVEQLVEAQSKNGQWDYTYRARKVKRDGDNSNTQFAVLALAAARAQGIEVPSEPFAKVREFLRGSQNEDGGFGYSDKERSRSYAAMTAGGAMCLAFAAAVERDEPAGLPPPAPNRPEIPKPPGPCPPPPSIPRAHPAVWSPACVDCAWFPYSLAS